MALCHDGPCAKKPNKILASLGTVLYVPYYIRILSEKSVKTPGLACLMIWQWVQLLSQIFRASTYLDPLLGEDLLA